MRVYSTANGHSCVSIYIRSSDHLLYYVHSAQIHTYTADRNGAPYQRIYISLGTRLSTAKLIISTLTINEWQWKLHSKTKMFPREIFLIFTHTPMRFLERWSRELFNTVYINSCWPKLDSYMLLLLLFFPFQIV